jgi:hypothetical protein
VEVSSVRPYPLGAEHLSPAINAAVAVLERRGLTVEADAHG